MKKFNLKKIKLPKQKKNFKKENILRINRNTFWVFLVFLFFIMVIAGLIFNYYIFRKFVETADFNTDNSFLSEDLNKKEEIEKFNSYFREREQKSLEIIENNNLIIDPSL
jgi:hypothetical protein